MPATFCSVTGSTQSAKPDASTEGADAPSLLPLEQHPTPHTMSNPYSTYAPQRGPMEFEVLRRYLIEAGASHQRASWLAQRAINFAPGLRQEPGHHHPSGEACPPLPSTPTHTRGPMPTAYELMEAYRAWWRASYSTTPNSQATIIAAA